jgi:hypothetical protein
MVTYLRAQMGECLLGLLLPLLLRCGQSNLVRVMEGLLATHKQYVRCIHIFKCMHTMHRNEKTPDQATQTDSH